MTKRLTKDALLTALALIMFIVEAQIPPPVPIPGLKLGLSNIITLYAMFAFGAGDALAILLVRIFLGSAFSGALSAVLYSLAGGAASYVVMLLLRRVVTIRQICFCSVFAAMAHNLGQMLAAVAILKTPSLMVYLPVLLCAAIVTGLFTALCAQYVINRLKKTNGMTHF